MFPALRTESETLIGHIDEMLDGIRNAAYGLSDDQARARPCRSALSIAGIIKHSTWIMTSELGERTSAPGSADGAAEFHGSFTPSDAESIDVLLARFDEARARYLAAMAALDPTAPRTAPPQPWDGITEPHEASTRILLTHHVEEFARHAGHADILREQLDGADAMGLRFAVEGREGNAYVQPWRPQGARGEGD